MSNLTLPTPVQALVDAINRGDTDAFVAVFTPDGVVDDWGRRLHGPKGVRSWADTDAIGAGAQMTVLSASTKGVVTEIRFAWRSRVFNGESSAFVTVEGDQIAEFRIPPHG